MANRGFNSIFLLIAIFINVQLDVVLSQNAPTYSYDENGTHDLGIQIESSSQTKSITVTIFYDSQTESGTAFFTKSLTTQLLSDLNSCGVKMVFNPCSTSADGAKATLLVCTQNDAQCHLDRIISCVTKTTQADPVKMGSFVICIFSGKNAEQCVKDSGVDPTVNDKCVSSGEGDTLCISYHDTMKQARDANAKSGNPNAIDSLKATVCNQKLLWIYGAICCLSVIIRAAEENADAGAINFDRETEDAADDSDDPFRIKRQHGHGASNPISGLLSSVFNKKLGLIGSLSSISSSSKGGVETHHHTYDYPHPPPPKPFDWWSFKKTILASLLQAVKAITGGVIALNGQLVKVKGHLLAAKGALLSTKGDSITNFGKHLAVNAFGHHQPAHSDVHEASLPAPASGATASGYGLTGPANIHGSLETGYPNSDFKSAIDYQSGYYKDPNNYAKRAAPAYFLVDNNTADKTRK